MNKQESKYFNTASLMDEALLVLLDKKDYEFITVKELCKKAGVSRATFYLHYESMNDLLEETLEMLNKKFKDSFPKEFTKEIAVREDKILTTSKYLTPYLTFIKENKKAFSLAARHPELFRSFSNFQKMYKDVFSPILDSMQIKIEEKEYLFEFFSKGVLSIVFKWLERDCKDDIELIIDIIERCTKAK